MATVAQRCPSHRLFVLTKEDTTTAPLALLSLSLSPTLAKPTKTPRKLQLQEESGGSNNNNEEEERERQRNSPFMVKNGSASRAIFPSPRPKKMNNPARRPIQSGSPIRALKVHLEKDSENEPDHQDDDDFIGAGMGNKTDSFRLGNQSQLERIQEADSSCSDESENEENEDSVYDGDEEEDEDVALQLYKSLSGDLNLRYDAASQQRRQPGQKRPTHQSYEDEDDDIVRI